MRKYPHHGSPAYTIHTVQKLCKNRPLSMITPTNESQIPISVWNCFLGALLHHLPEGNSNQLLGLKVFEELENTGKSNLQTAEAMLECLSDRRNWELLKNPREGILFAQQIFQVALQNPRYGSEKSTVGRTRLWTKWLKINVKHGKHEVQSLEILGQIKAECSELFSNADAIMQLIYPSIKYGRAIFLHRLFNSLSPVTVISPLDLHHIFCNEHLMVAHDASEVVIRWLKAQGVFNRTLPIWDEISAIRLLEWCSKRALIPLNDSNLVEKLSLLSLNELGRSGRIKRAYLDKYINLAKELGNGLSEESKMVVDRYDNSNMFSLEEFEGENDHSQIALCN
jgi:hypothetical protein